MNTGDATSDAPPAGRRLTPLGDSAILIDFEAVAGTDPAATARDLCAAVRAQQWPFVRDLVPAFRSLCIHYDPLGLGAQGQTPASWMAQLAALAARPAPAAPARRHQLPVCYEGDCGLDLASAARDLNLRPAALIALHAEAIYTVAMIGFSPGFPYLEGLPEALCLPRRACPRAAVPAGSVAVTSNLCGIYPVRSPGGWQVLGRTPVRLFDPAGTPPARLAVGDQVRFVPIDRPAFEALCRP